MKKGSKVWRKKEQARQDWHKQSDITLKTVHEVAEEEAEKEVELHKAKQKVVNKLKQGKIQEALQQVPKKEKQGVEEVSLTATECSEEEEKEDDPVEEVSTPSKKGDLNWVKAVKRGKESKKTAAKTAPLKKGGPPDVKGSASSSGVRPGVMIDFHNTLALGREDYVPEEHLVAIEALLRKGYRVHVVSFCFHKREQKVMKSMKSLRIYPHLEKCYCIQVREGEGSKGYLCKEDGLKALFDDHRVILEDALERGIDVYPIISDKEAHEWIGYRKGDLAKYANLAVAIYKFLAKEEQ